MQGIQSILKKSFKKTTGWGKVWFPLRYRVGNKLDIDITNTHFCSLLLLGSENISRTLLHKEAVPGFPLEIVVAKDNEFLLFQAYFLWRTLRYFFDSSADSIQDEMEFQGDPVSSVWLTSLKSQLCASIFSFSSIRRSGTIFPLERGHLIISAQPV